MTIKLAKFFGNSIGTSTSLSIQPQNNTTTTQNYYYSTNQNQQRQQLNSNNVQQTAHNNQQYNTYNEDDDNMSLYSTAASIITSRDHPYNHSQRPLLAERKPQLLYKKKLTNSPQQQQKQQQQQQQQQQQHQLQRSNYQQQQQQQQQLQTTSNNRHEMKYKENSCISPYVQQQKRDTAKGLHGFNDFDILSEKYNNHLNSPHVGYPYGSPPSPTAISNDNFTFDAAIASPIITTTTTTTTAATATTAITTTGTTIADNHQYQQQQHQQQHQHHHHHHHYANIPPFNYDINVNNFTNSTPTYFNNYYELPNNFIDNGTTNTQIPTTNGAQNYAAKSSRFEDDFCYGRDMNFTNHIPTTTTTKAAATNGKITTKTKTVTATGLKINTNLKNDNYVYEGVPTDDEQQTNFNHFGGHHFNDIPDTVINGNNYQKVTQQPNNDTSTSSNECQRSKRGLKFFLLKHKSKKNKKAKQLNAITTTATAEAAAAAATTTTTKTSAKKKLTIKCVVVGDGAVGKTNLILSYLENRFIPEHVPTASDIYNADVMVNDSPVHLTVCDTAGQDNLDLLRELCYPDSDVFLLCFSVTKPETFHAIKTKWANKFSKTNAALILVGTQCDLRTNPNVLNKLKTNGENAISCADAWDLATKIGAKYIETSSVSQEKIKEVFDTAIWEGLIPKTLPPTPPFWRRIFCLA